MAQYDVLITFPCLIKLETLQYNWQPKARPLLCSSAVKIIQFWAIYFIDIMYTVIGS